MSQHECDGADCCREYQTTKIANAYLNGLISLEEYSRKVAELDSQHLLLARLSFLEVRRVELQEMCELRTRELIEAKGRIAFLERLVGKLYAEAREESE